MKRVLSCLLVLLLVFSSSAPVVVAAEDGNSEVTSAPTGTDGEPLPVSSGEPLPVSPGDVSSGDLKGSKVTFYAFDVVEGMKTISDANHEMTASTKKVGEVSLTEEKKLATGAPSAPAMPGWEFAGWYTAPVKYAFWGDFTTSTAATEPIPAGFEVDCDGQRYNFNVNRDENPDILHSLTDYWRWLSTLASPGKKVDLTKDSMEDIDALYALYQPSSIQFTLDYSGWNRRTGVMSCGRRYGTPFGSDSVSAWEGFVFDGWYLKDSDTKMDFYSIPENGACYVAHWHSADGSVNWSNYREQGYTPVASVVMQDANKVDLGGILQLHAGTGIGQTIYVAIKPGDSGVTKLTWENTDSSVASLEVLEDGMRAVVRPTSKEGTTVITVKSANGCFDSVVVDTKGHAWDNSTVVQWGNCSKPTKILYTCVYCGKTEVRESYKSHQYAYRDIAATCTTPHIWEHYCKVCGYVDTEGNTTEGPALGHSFQTTVVKGCGGTVTTHTCTVCSYTETSNDNVAVHNWSKVATVDVRPTCHSEGSQSIKCLDCGVIQDGSSVMIPADPSLHVWGDWVVDKEATETVEGEKFRTCSTCGQKETRVIPPTSFEVDTSGITDNMTSGSKSEEVADQEQADNALKNTMDKLLSGENGGMLADDILYAAIQEKEISTEVRVTPVSAPENASDASRFNELLGGAPAVYMDIDIFVTADGESIGRITETEDVMTFNVALPSGGRIVRVLRAHEGTVEAIPCWVENGNVYFTTDKFSTFAVSVSNDISLAETEPIASQVYTGSEITPAVKIIVNGNEVLEEGKDYTISYRNNVQPGQASIVITGLGVFAGTSREVTFTIVKETSGSDGGDSGTSESVENKPVTPSQSSSTEGSESKPAAPAHKGEVKTDWEKVILALDGADKGANVDVKTGKEFTIPVKVQNQVAKDKVTLACQIVDTDITITLSSYAIKKVKEDITVRVSDAANIPKAAEREVTNQALYSRVLDIGEKKFFSQKMDIHMVLGTQYAGKLAVMYSYNEITGKMRFESSFRITSKGLAMFPLLRGDEYVIVVLDNGVKPVGGTAAGGMESSYRVVAGDTLSKIAARNGIIVSEILDANPQIKNANIIYVGDRIRIPEKK